MPIINITKSQHGIPIRTETPGMVKKELWIQIRTESVLLHTSLPTRTTVEYEQKQTEWKSRVCAEVNIQSGGQTVLTIGATLLSVQKSNPSWETQSPSNHTPHQFNQREWKQREFTLNYLEMQEHHVNNTKGVFVYQLI